MPDSNDLFEHAFRYSAVGIGVVAPSGRWLRVNEAVCKLLGYQENELLEIDFQSITHPEDLEADLRQVQALLGGNGNSYRLEKRYFHRDGSLVWVLLSVSLVRTEKGQPRFFISQMQDITEQKQALEELHRRRQQLEIANLRLQQLVVRDSLTGVLNRHGFDERFNEELSRCHRFREPLSLLLIDVDHFKSLNDLYGHVAGDRALRRVAEVLRSGGRLEDIVCRYGGEEFAVILSNTDAEGCATVAERLRLAIEAIESLERKLTVSLGGVTIDHQEQSPSAMPAEVLIAEADAALYIAKQTGRNRVILRELEA